MKDLLLVLREEFIKTADEDKALKMQAYMKSKMPYHGVPVPLVRKICKRVFADVDLSNKYWEKTVLYLWRNAKFREERYSALNLCADKRAQEFQKPAVLHIYEEMIVTGAWWDYVDEISHRIGFLLREYPKQMKPKMLTWSESSDTWKRRSSIICQLDLKKGTDLKLLYACIEPSLASKEFFLQKAIGWALRQYAWTDPSEIKRYVKENRDRLAPLSRREALKNV